MYHSVHQGTSVTQSHNSRCASFSQGSSPFAGLTAMGRAHGIRRPRMFSVGCHVCLIGESLAEKQTTQQLSLVLEDFRCVLESLTAIHVI